jgi:hypothetical protein
MFVLYKILTSSDVNTYEVCFSEGKAQDVPIAHRTKHSPKAAKTVESPKPLITSFGRAVKKPNRMDLLAVVYCHTFVNMEWN